MELEEQQDERRPLWRSFLVGRNPAWTLLRILFVVLSSLILFKFVLVPIRVTGSSMYPTYKDGQINLINKLSYWNSDPQRMDIVAVQFAGREILLLKRILGLPGETVQVVTGQVHINGERLNEPYVHGTISHKVDRGSGRSEILRTSRSITLGPDEYFMVGDNREVSELHLEPRRKIMGKVLF